MKDFSSKVSLIWSIADILRGGWKQHEYQDVIVPLIVLKRLDSVLENTKPQVLALYNEYKDKMTDLGPFLKNAAGAQFYNTSRYDFKSLLSDPDHIVKNFRNYILGYSKNIQDIYEKFDFEPQLKRLDGGNMLYLIIQKINEVNLNPDSVDNYEMGHIFEELLRKFAEMSNETAGEHYTPRDVIELAVRLLIEPDIKDVGRDNAIVRIYDPACGTGGMLTEAKAYITDEINPMASVYLFGQELNSVTYAIAKSDMLVKGEDADRIKGGEKEHNKASTLTNDQFAGESFDYCLSNPPYGTDWKKDKDAVEKEFDRGFAGRFAAGLPRISDGQMLFLQHLVSKMKPERDGGSRIVVVHNGSPLFTGDAGSGESEIRRWILEKDLLEAIVALPDQMFYNTGINTYLWVLSNHKENKRKGKVQLIDARTFYEKMRKSLGNKRKEIDSNSKDEVIRLRSDFKENEFSKIFKTTDFGYRQITIERPLRLNFCVSNERVEKIKESKAFEKLPSEEKVSIIDLINKFPNKDTIYNSRNKFEKDFNKHIKEAKISSPLKKALFEALSERDENAEICLDSNGNFEADSELRDYENVPFGTDVYEYFDKEVKPYAPDAWINEDVKDEKDGKVGVVGYEIPFTRHFYKYEEPRKLEEIESDIEKVENELLELLKQL